MANISEGALNGCSSLKAINIGVGAATIGSNAFKGCQSVDTLRVYASVPPTCASDALTDIDPSKCTLFVPTGTRELYAAADQWKNFYSIEEFDASVKASYIEVYAVADTVAVGDVQEVVAKVFPALATNPKVEWTSSNPAVASVDEDGFVTPYRQGMTEITATTTDGSNLSDCCVVNVDARSNTGDNRFEIYYAKGESGKTLLFPVVMANADGVIGFQFDVVFDPATAQQITLDRTSEGSYYLETTNRFDDHLVVASATDSGARFVSYSELLKEYSGNDDVLFYIPFKVAGDPGRIEIVLKNIKISRTGSVEEVCPDLSAKIDISADITAGDVNGDGRLSILDLTMTVSQVLGEGLFGFRAQAADMDGNGEITVNDITAILRLVLQSAGVDVTTAGSAAGREGAAPLLSVSGYRINGARADVEISLEGASQYIALQADITLPADVEIADVQLGSGAAPSRPEVVWSRSEVTGKWRVVVWSLQCTPLGSGAAPSRPDAAPLLTVSLRTVDGTPIDYKSIAFGTSLAVTDSGDAQTEVALGGVGTVLDPLRSGAVLSRPDGLQISVEGLTVTVRAPEATAVSVCDALGRYSRVDVPAGVSTFTLPAPGLYIIGGVKYLAK